MLIEGILVTSRLHPSENQRAATAHDVHKTSGFLERLDGASVHPGVDGDEIDAIGGMTTNNIEKVLGFDGDKRLFQIADRIVHGHGADHSGGFLDKLRAEGLRLAAVGKIHDGLGAKL